jgi:response regulator RpfG family c-di-GMP phosphodiesterase
MLFEECDFYDLYKNDNAQGIDIEKQDCALASNLELLRAYKPNLHDSVHSIGKLASAFGREYGITETQYFIACYYANFSYLAVENIYKSPTFPTPQENEAFNMHAISSSDMLMRQGLEIASEITYYHHEFPDGTGLSGSQRLRYKESYFINIAEEFVNLITTKAYRPGYNRVIAMHKALAKFELDRLFGEGTEPMIKELMLDTQLSVGGYS